MDIPNLTPSQVNLGVSIIDRAKLSVSYSRLTMAQRYRRMIQLVDQSLSDPLVASSHGYQNLDRVREYFEAKASEFERSSYLP